MKGKEKICGTPVDICAKGDSFIKRIWNSVILVVFHAPA
jgi:hypothetical protein